MDRQCRALMPATRRRCVRQAGLSRAPWPARPIASGYLGAQGFSRGQNRAVRVMTLPQGQWQLIYADPPWRYNDLGHSRRIDRHYPVMRPLEIAQMPINSIAAADS